MKGLGDVMPKIAVQNVLRPGKTYSVDAAKFNAMAAAVLRVLPGPPGMSVAELGKAVLAHLPQDLFPGGEKAGWWLKSAQLDLEARGLIRRDGSTPLRLSQG